MRSPDRARAEVTHLRAGEHLESPLWDWRDERLLWVDQYRGELHRSEPFGKGFRELEVSVVDAPLGAVALAAGGGWVVTAGKHVRWLEGGGRERAIHRVIQPASIGVRFNDAKVDPWGRLWLGTMGWPYAPLKGALFLLDRGDLQTIKPSVSISNGLAWNRAKGLMYYVDTPTRRIERILLTASGAIAGELSPLELGDLPGNPDGISIDDEGCLWVALWGGGRVVRLTPSGELLSDIVVPAPRVSSCCFGEGGSTLFITTSTEGADEEELQRWPESGSVYKAKLAVGGPAASEYEGGAK